MNGIIIFAAIYGTLIGGDFVSAPDKVIVDNVWRGTASLTEAQANAIGYKLLIDEPPACAENEYAVAVGYAEDARIRRVYEKREVAPAVAVYSAARLVYWLNENGLYSKAKEALGESVILQAVALGEFRADNADFVEMRPMIEAAFGAEVVADALRYAAATDSANIRDTSSPSARAD